MCIVFGVQDVEAFLLQSCRNQFFRLEEAAAGLVKFCKVDFVVFA